MRAGLVKIVLVMMFVFIGSVVLAQNNQSKIDQMSRELSLSEDQRTKVQAIFNNEKKKVEAVFAEEQKKLQKIQEETRSSLQAVLTPDQMKKLESKMRQKK